MAKTIPQIKTIEDVELISDWGKHLVTIVLENMVFDSGHDQGHLVRVVNRALRYANGEGDQDVIIAGALLHDLVNLPKDHPQRSEASTLSAEKATTLLVRDLDTPMGVEQFVKLTNTIEAHSYSANIETKCIEAMAVQDADRIDSLGMMGIARLFAVSGALNRPLFDPDDPLAERRELDELAWGLDHFAVKLAKLPKTMKTPKGRTDAEIRVAEMCQFIADLIIELEDASDEFSVMERVIRFSERK